MKITALLTGRGNNTLKDKNISLVNGNPLLRYPAMAAKNSKYIQNFFVSSDDDKILNIASEDGYVKIKRPEEYARPDSKHIDALVHAISVMEQNYSFVPDIMVVLLANSATVKTEWIDDCIQKIINDPSVTAVVPVEKELDHHPYRAKKISKDGSLKSFFDFKEAISTNRQDLEPNYFLCHNFWVLNVSKSIYTQDGEAPWSFMGKKVLPYEVEDSFDIHTEEDLIKTEKWLIKNDITL